MFFFVFFAEFKQAQIKDSHILQLVQKGCQIIFDF